jgi:hypothetical protein
MLMAALRTLEASEGQTLDKQYLPYYITIVFKRHFLDTPPTEEKVGEGCQAESLT